MIPYSMRNGLLLMVLLTSAACSGIACRRLPEGVHELLVKVVPSKTDIRDGLFPDCEYILSDGVMNSKPDADESYETYYLFRGTVSPLTVTSDGEYVMPLRCFVTPLPFYQRQVNYWEPGMAVDIGSSATRYNYKLREGEVGLCFILQDPVTKKAYIYPEIGRVIPASQEEVSIGPIHSLPKAPASALAVLAAARAKRW